MINRPEVIHTFNSVTELLVSVATDLQKLSEHTNPSHIALSGGSTPKQLFKFLANSAFSDSIHWHTLHFWWGDERCVPVAHEESNYGVAAQLLFEHITIPAKNIHRIRGEADTEKESQRYALEIEQTLPEQARRPCFDWVILGVGEDGHTASLFPNQTDYQTELSCIVAIHPQSQQKRISISAPVINNAKRVSYLALGSSKQKIVADILSSHDKCSPAAKIRSTKGLTEWYLDKPAAALFEHND